MLLVRCLSWRQPLQGGTIFGRLHLDLLLEVSHLRGLLNVIVLFP